MIGLHERDRTGVAQLVDSAQLSAGLDALGPEVAASNAAAVLPSGRRSRHYRFGEMCETADGDWIAIECVTEAHEQALAAAYGDLDGVAVRLRGQPTAAICQALRDGAVPHAIVQRRFGAENVERRPGNLQRYIDPRAGEIRYPEVPWVFSATPVRAGVPLGAMGRDTALLPAILRRWRGQADAKLAAE